MHNTVLNIVRFDHRDAQQAARPLARRYAMESSVVSKFITKKLSVIIYALFSLNLAYAETIDVAKYANIAIGHEWTYAQSASPNPWRQAVEAETVKNGHEVFVIQDYNYMGDKDDQDYIKKDFFDGMFLVGNVNDFGQSTETVNLWTPPQPRLLSVFIPGEVYDFGITHSSGFKIDATLEIERDAVTVPIGAFSNAWKSTLTLYVVEGGYVFQRWYVKDIGMVKYILEDGNTWELTSVSGFTLPGKATSFLPVVEMLLDE